AGKVDDRQVAFAGHAAEMPAPIEKVHVKRWRIGQLHNKYLVSGDRADRIGRDATRQAVETVEDEADIGVIGPAHHLPGIAVIVDVPAPGQGFITHLEAASGCALT